MVRVLGYHATDACNALAIRRWGLRKRNTEDHNYPWIPDQPEGVYFFLELTEQQESWICARWGRAGLKVGRACVVIDLLGLPFRSDRMVDFAKYTPHDIGPERCTVITPMSGPRGARMSYREIMEARAA